MKRKKDTDQKPSLVDYALVGALMAVAIVAASTEVLVWLDEPTSTHPTVQSTK